ncbi:DUF4097 family beta strand repeat-containing protein [Streptomyces griseocarneus]|uniref:DUF4097 family beta strand repeat-containing protein n=1 Tax=Streptomyces griseocarneus TaxID=51201 RepID=UPI00167DEF4E|nr:DUF4097 family beta strand repeat-containing protein [Streptomyces griseocarneus]MBZ6472220.1 DUF4097 family beta strand repeat-containing protein [Streptomyces griseocarneus]GHG73173.1 lipoprotein [Streptomyces griseocarneus]
MLPRARRAVRLSALAGGVLAAAVALTGCATVDADDATPEHKAFSLAGRELTVDTDNSAIELVPATGNGKDVQVTRWFDGWSMGGETGVSWEMEGGDTLKLRMKCKGLSVDCEAKHRIEVPRGVAVTVKGSNGAVKARGFETALNVRTSNGAIDIRDAKGTVELRSSNGAVTAEGLRAPKVKATTSNGEIRIGLARVPDEVRTSAGNGATRITLPRAPYKVDTKSGNGGVNVDVPRDDASRHEVTARSGNGAIEVRTAG